MTDTSMRPPEPDESGDSTASVGAAGQETDPAVALQAAAAETAELKDKLLRALAEIENMRRRSEREVADARLYGISAFARDVLTVADNMQRALQALDAGLRQNADATTKALLDGVELTERELLNALEKHGIKKLEPLGQKFDPNFHQAMFEVMDESVPPGTVMQVVQPGYKIGERVLRPALVGVAKGGPKSAAEPAPSAVAANNNAEGSDEPQ
jgi:molecular chaperone GrpE